MENQYQRRYKNIYHFITYMFPTSYSTVFMISLLECYGYENSHEDRLSVVKFFSHLEVSVILKFFIGSKLKNKEKMPSGQPLPPKENSLFKRILVSYLQQYSFSFFYLTFNLCNNIKNKFIS